MKLECFLCGRDAEATPESLMKMPPLCGDCETMIGTEPIGNCVDFPRPARSEDIDTLGSQYLQSLGMTIASTIRGILHDHPNKLGAVTEIVRGYFRGCDIGPSAGNAMIALSSAGILKLSTRRTTGLNVWGPAGR